MEKVHAAPGRTVARQVGRGIYVFTTSRSASCSACPPSPGRQAASSVLKQLFRRPAVMPDAGFPCRP